MATNPRVTLGTLNRIRGSVVFPSNTSLNITSSYMTKKFVDVTFDGDFVDQIETATGIVNSPAPYVKAQATVGVLRTTGLASLFLAQVQSQAVVGQMHIHSDTSAFPSIVIHNVSIIKANPGAYDGMSGELSLTLSGIFYTNNDLWNLI